MASQFNQRRKAGVYTGSHNCCCFKIGIKPRRSRRGIHDGHDVNKDFKKRRVLCDNTVVYVVVKKRSPSRFKIQGSGFRPSKHTYMQKHFGAQALNHECVIYEEALQNP